MNLRVAVVGIVVVGAWGCAGAGGSSAGGGSASSGGGSASSGGGSASSGGGSAASGGGSAASGGGSATGGGSAASGGGSAASGGGSAAGGGSASGGGTAQGSPTIAGCPIFPANHIFNTPIDTLPVHPSSSAFVSKLGAATIHLDLGQTENQSSANYFGIPYNVVNGTTLTWSTVAYTSSDASLDWMPRDEADCAVGSAHTLVSPCLASAAPSPQFPIPPNPLVEGGLLPDVVSSPGGDHHLLMLDSSSCRLWELYHVYSSTSPAWHIFGSASFDLRSNALRPATWTSADAAGFPILPLLLRADEASSGTINHALRFTMNQIRNTYTWPARHKIGSSVDTTRPPMGQLFRLKASYAIPAGYSTQSKAILTALKRYGMYLSDVGTELYIQGEPKAAWSSTVFSQVQTVPASEFEAVDLSAITSRAGFNPDSAAVPPP
ncbi:MAG: hypothetical protein K1X89_27520 [Myxococcaceae bacterium]|nr:hypothetical protein [Myxococcaceae bacterium]